MFVRAVAAALRGQAALLRGTHGAIEVLSGVALHALHEHELDSMAALLYDATPLHRGERIEAWEQHWWSTSLPKKPGRILVAGCGAGRELTWLVSRGWQVEAFDPAASLVHLARARLGPRARIERADFRDFIAQAPARGPFDAVLLGWGSFAHCLSSTSRAALLRSCDECCPKGPLLLSWHAMPQQEHATEHVRHSRARRWGARVGRAVGAMRAVHAAGRDDLVLLPHAGAVSYFPIDEVKALAARLSRHLLVHEQPMPHGALVSEGRAHKRAPEAVAVDLLADVLLRHGAARVVARGSSMTPAIPSGARAELVPPGALTHGDVVAARVRGSLVMHRVVGLDFAGRALLKGDACPSPDGWVERGCVLARVEAIDDGSGERPVPAATRALPRWRRVLARVRRAGAALLAA